MAHVEDMKKILKRIELIESLACKTLNPADLNKYNEELTTLYNIPNAEIHDAIEMVRERIKEHRAKYSGRAVHVVDANENELDAFNKIFGNAFDIDKKTGKKTLNEKVATLIAKRNHIEIVGEISVEKIKVALEGSQATKTETAGVGQTYKPSKNVNLEMEEIGK
jgi:hypothetical protein